MAFKTFGPEAPAQSSRRSGGGGGDELTIGGILWHLLSFSGTATRMEFWVVFAVNTVLTITFAVALYVFYGDQPPEGLFSLALIIPGILYSTVSNWISLSTMVRRLRDRGWSNSKMAIVLVGSAVLSAVPIVGLLVMPLALWVFIECGFLGGES